MPRNELTQERGGEEGTVGECFYSGSAAYFVTEEVDRRESELGEL